jgi:membrane dipeptidase
VSTTVAIQVLQPEQLPEATEGLLKRGYPEDDIRGVLGLNWLRVARQVWK